MDVLDGLAAVLTAVVYNAVAVCESRICGDLRNSLEDLGNALAVALVNGVSTADMSLRNNENMNGSLRIYILTLLQKSVRVSLCVLMAQLSL